MISIPEALNNFEAWNLSFQPAKKIMMFGSVIALCFILKWLLGKIFVEK